MKQYILVIAALLCCQVVSAKKYHYIYSGNCSKGYQYYMSLRPDEGRAMMKKELISDPYNLMATYISDYDDCLLLLFNGDKLDYEQLKNHQNERLALMERGDEQSPWHRLCKAGIYMHWAFIQMRFNENFKAAASFRKSYLLLKENNRLFPGFEYNNIFFGIEQATVGALPDNYKWVASIFGMRGNVQSGVAKVKKFIEHHQAGDPFYNEAVIYYAYLNYYIQSDKEEAWRTVSGSRFSTEDNLVNCFVKSNIAINFRKAGEAISVLKYSTSIDAYHKYPILDYEYGYALLYKGDKEAVSRFNSFLKNYKGIIFVKDAWQKLAYAYYLQGNMKMAEYCRGKILTAGNAITDSDKQAMRFAEHDTWPHLTLLKAQLLTDGGYYKDAYSILVKAEAGSLKTISAQLEYYFRLARVHDELGNTTSAVEYYNKAIETGKNRQEQFAARSALQLGFLYEKSGQKEVAVKMFNLALSMKNHDFKNSIDQQAKAGINRLSK